MTTAGLAAGAITAWVLSTMLVKVFDPHLAVLGSIAILASIAAVVGVLADARRPGVDLLRAV